MKWRAPGQGRAGQPSFPPPPGCTALTLRRAAFFCARLFDAGGFGLNGAVRVKSGSLVAFVIVVGAAVIAVVAWFVRPPPPPQDAPATRAAVSAPSGQ